jgi:hypothetical protein
MARYSLVHHPSVVIFSVRWSSAGSVLLLLGCTGCLLQSGRSIEGGLGSPGKKVWNFLFVTFFFIAHAPAMPIALPRSATRASRAAPLRRLHPFDPFDHEERVNACSRSQKKSTGGARGGAHEVVEGKLHVAFPPHPEGCARPAPPASSFRLLTFFLVAHRFPRNSPCEERAQKDALAAQFFEGGPLQEF